MEEYFCDNCGTKLGEEQKFCPKCGTPKKQVPENISVDQLEDGPRYCIRCGRQITADNMYCPECGKPVNPVSTTNASQAQDFVQQMRTVYKTSDQSNDNNYNNYNNWRSSYVNTGEDDAYIQVKVYYYKRKFEKFWMSETKSSWNWCAFLFVPFWFIYRKMYKWGFAALAIQFVFSIIGGWGSSLLLFAMAITSGVLSNYIYKLHIDKLVNEGRTLNEPFKSQHIHKFGGVNKAAMILTLIGYIILMSILSSAGIYGNNTYSNHSYNFSDTSNTTYAVSGCTNYDEYGNYCIDHGCLVDGCTNQREPGSDF